MNKREKQKSFRIWAIAMTVLLAAFLCLKKDNVFRWIQAGFTIHDQNRTIEALEEDNARLDKRVRDLTTDRDSLERYARERFNFSRPDEDVYIVEE